MHQTGTVQGDQLEGLTASVRAFHAGASEPLHVHDDEGQLKWPRSHAMVSTPPGIFVLPPGWAVWIPAGNVHGGVYPEASQEHNVHVFAASCGGLPTKCCAVRITQPLERAWLASLGMRRRASEERSKHDQELLSQLRGEVADLGVLPVPVVLPTTSRIRPVVDALIDNPSSTRSLSQWASVMEMSSSTLNRMFLREAGATFGEWRKHARLLRALAQLARGSEVASVARALGYRPSSFIHMFRQTLGTTPAQYYRAVGPSALPVQRPGAAHTTD